MADYISSEPLIESVGDEEVRDSRTDPRNASHLPSTSDISVLLNSPIRSANSLQRSGPLLDYIRYAQHHCDEPSRETFKQLEEADNLLRRKKHAEAISCMELTLLTSNPGASLQCLLWRLLGNAHLSLGQYKKASVCFLHHLAFCRELNDFDGATKAECSLGISYMKLGMLKLAGRCFLRYLENCRVLQDKMSVAKALSNLGVLSRILAARAYEASKEDNGTSMNSADSTLKKAIAYFEQHLEIVEQYGDLEKQARAYGNLGSCHEMARQYPQAMFCHGKRLEIARMNSDWRSECYALCSLGNCCRANHKHEEALEYYTMNLELSRSTENIAGEVASLLNLGATCELLGRTQKAIEWYTLYLSITVQLKDLLGQARALATLADLSEEIGDIKKARIYYTKLVDIFQQLGDQKAVTMATEHLTCILSNKSNKKPKQKFVNKVTEKKFIGSHEVQRGEQLNSCHFGLRHWNQTVPCLSGGTWGLNCSTTSPLVLENHRAIRTFENSVDHLYNDKNMVQALFEQEADHLLYKMGDYTAMPLSMSSHTVPPLQHLTNPLPNPPADHSYDCNNSASEYATITEEMRTSASKPHDMRRGRHFQELKKMSEDFSKPVTELGIESTDREWSQWLEIQGLMDDSTLCGGSNVEMTTFGKKGHTETKTANSVPHSLDVL